MFKKPESKPNFYTLEQMITQFWKENKIFEKSISQRENSPAYVFYDGPPFMSGTPHYATLLSSMAKDAIPRYQSMKGKKVERVWGWDCHGLPIENKVEKELGLRNRQEIEEFGLQKFIEKCYEWNRVGIENWRWYIEKIGRWADIDNAYRTMDQDFMESVWWNFKQMWNKDLIYKGKRVSLFSTDSSTPVSNFEVSMDPDNYQDTEDIAIAVKFKLTAESILKLGSKITKEKVFMVAWTTTPWTLPSNFALAINPDAEYVVIDFKGENLILAKERLEYIEEFKDEYTIYSAFKAKELEGLSYIQLYNEIGKNGANDFKIYLSNYVTTEDGTGVLHVAPAFGEEDNNLGKEHNLSDESNIDEGGMLLYGPQEAVGKYIRTANPIIANDLEQKGLLLKQEKYIHKLPYYRYKNPLIYKAQVNYFINVQKLKDQLIKSNEEINWIPEHFKEGRFKNVLETAPDWSISRSRYWGTAMPVWISSDGEEVSVGSRDELMELVNNSNIELKIRKVILVLDNESNKGTSELVNSMHDFIKSSKTTIKINTNQENLSHLRETFFGETEIESKVKPLKVGEERSYYLLNEKALDLHRPYIDDVYFIRDNKEFRRIKETMDVWMDSGSMPFAQFNYPFSNKGKFELNFPGDFIAEYTGQIRAWFYVLHVISNALFDKPSFKNVLVTGVLAGNDGRKMSKSYGNYPDPKMTIEKYGGEALRLYFLSSTVLMGNDIDFNEEELKMQTREILLPIWNIYTYISTYANIIGWKASSDLNKLIQEDVENELDAWILLKLNETIKEVNRSLDSYIIPKSIRAIKELIEDTSKWYIRRSRDRFAEGDQMALSVLYYVFIETMKLLAPFAPFITEYIYKELVADHLSDDIATGKIKESIHLTDYPEHDQKFIDQYIHLNNEMNFVRKICDLGQAIRGDKGIKVRQPLERLEIINQNQDVPMVSEWMQEVIKSEINVKEVVDTPIFTASETSVQSEDLSINVKVALETRLSESLIAEGVQREVIRSVQALRKNLGFEQGEEIKLYIFTQNEQLSETIQTGSAAIVEAVTASSIDFNEISGEEVKEFSVNDSIVKIKIER